MMVTLFSDAVILSVAEFCTQSLFFVLLAHTKPDQLGTVLCEDVKGNHLTPLHTVSNILSFCMS